MAAYSYKDVEARITEECVRSFEKIYGDPPDYDPNYDGDLWTLVNILLDMKEEEVDSLTKHNEALQRRNDELSREVHEVVNGK